MCSPGRPLLVGYPFWAGSDGGLQEERYFSLSLARIGKRFANRNSQNNLRRYARGRVGLRKVQDGEVIPEPILDRL